MRSFYQHIGVFMSNKNNTLPRTPFARQIPTTCFSRTPRTTYNVIRPQNSQPGHQSIVVLSCGSLHKQRNVCRARAKWKGRKATPGSFFTSRGSFLATKVNSILVIPKKVRSRVAAQHGGARLVVPHCAPPGRSFMLAGSIVSRSLDAVYNPTSKRRVCEWDILTG